MGRYLKGLVDETQALSTLAAKTAISIQFGNTVNERTLCSSIVATWSLANFTDIADGGPILAGVCHSDYVTAEIEEFLETSGSWNEGNLTEQEIANRKIRRVVTFNSADSENALEVNTANNGKPIKTKLNWILNQGQSLRLWAYNSGTAALATTNPDVRVLGHANLFPK